MGNVIHVNLVVNEKYMPGANVAAASVCVGAKDDTELVFHLFTEDVEDSSVQFFTQVVKRLHSKSDVVQYKCNEDTLKGLPYWGESRMSALRCSYAKLLPNVDICVHLDADVLFLGSIEEYVGFLSSEFYGVASCEQDLLTAERECAWIFCSTGVRVEINEYFLAGMMVMNLRKMRENGLSEKFLQFFAEHPDVRSPDQDALNTFFAGKIKCVPKKWNLLQTILTDEFLKERPVIHYVCGVPWSPKLGVVANGRFELWHRFADKYVWQKEGESYRRNFSLMTLMIKYSMYYILKTPIIGIAFAKMLEAIGRVVSAEGWIRTQVGCDVSKRAIDEVLAIK